MWLLKSVEKLIIAQKINFLHPRSNHFRLFPSERGTHLSLFTLCASFMNINEQVSEERKSLFDEDRKFIPPCYPYRCSMQLQWSIVIGIDLCRRERGEISLFLHRTSSRGEVARQCACVEGQLAGWFSLKGLERARHEEPACCQCGQSVRAGGGGENSGYLSTDPHSTLSVSWTPHDKGLGPLDLYLSSSPHLVQFVCQCVLFWIVYFTALHSLDLSSSYMHERLCSVELVDTPPLAKKVENKQQQAENMEQGDFVTDLVCMESGRVNRAYDDPVLLNDHRVLANLMMAEDKYVPTSCYFNCVQTDVKPFMRKMVSEWMAEVSTVFCFFLLKYFTTYRIFSRGTHRKFTWIVYQLASEWRSVALDLYLSEKPDP